MTTLTKKNDVLRIPPADPRDALAHFESLMVYETDCWDVHASLALDDPGFVLLDVRSKELFERGHVPGATNLPNWRIRESRLEGYAPETLFVVYCAGPHCNGATKAAIHLSRLGRFVKLMIGGVEGWKDEGFSLTRSA